MAISLVQSTDSSFTWFTNAQSTTAFGSAVTVGNVIVACVIAGTNAADVTSVTDTKGNTYTKLFQWDDTASNGTDLEIWTAPVTTGGTSNVVTAHDSGANLWWVAAYEVSGLAATIATDQTITVSQIGSGKSAATTAFSSSTTNNPDLLVQMNFMVGLANTFTYTATSGWSGLETGYDFTDSSAKGFALASQVKVVTTTGTFSTQITASTTASAQADGIMVAIKGTASGGVTAHLLSMLGVGS